MILENKTGITVSEEIDSCPKCGHRVLSMYHWFFHSCSNCDWEEFYVHNDVTSIAFVERENKKLLKILEKIK